VALKATICKAELQISDLDRHYYQTHALTLARHPSETDERMMLRVLAFALHADPALFFGGGLSTTDEPALWLKDLTGIIELWIEVGLPETKLLRKAAGRAKKVVVYTYGRGADIWWGQHGDDLQKIEKLTVCKIPLATSQALAALAERSMQLQCLVQEGDVSLSNAKTTVTVTREVLKP
jgi:uncharacterized protein YaeQ